MSNRTAASKKKRSSPSSSSALEPLNKKGLGKEEEEQMWEAMRNDEDMKKFYRSVVSKSLNRQQYSYMAQKDERGSDTIVCMIDPSKPIQKEPESKSMKDSFSGYQLIGSSRYARLFSDPDKKVKTMKASANRWSHSLNAKLHFGRIVDGELEYDPVTIAVAFLWIEAFFKVPVDAGYAEIMTAQAKLEYIRSFRRALQRHEEWKARIALRSQQSELHSRVVGRNPVAQSEDPLLFDDEEILNMHITDPDFMTSLRIGDFPSPCLVKGVRGDFLDGFVLEDINQLDDDGNFELSEGT